MVKYRVSLLLLCSFLLLLLTGCLARREPTGSLSTEAYQFSISRNELLAEKDGNSVVIFKGDRNGSIISAVVTPYRVYVLCDDELFSMDAEGSNTYKIADKCYNPGELASVITSGDTSLHSIGYYDGYVYYIQYGTQSTLMRFAVGGVESEEISRNQVAAFSITDDGVFTGYSEADGLGNREVTWCEEIAVAN